jgi:hypothetical protein
MQGLWLGLTENIMWFRFPTLFFPDDHNVFSDVVEDVCLHSDPVFFVARFIIQRDAKNGRRCQQLLLLEMFICLAMPTGDTILNQITRC